MSIARHKRHDKRQMGQFMTPRPMAEMLVANMPLNKDHKVLEPSMGDGSFIIPLISRFMKFYSGNTQEKLTQVLWNNIYGVELDEMLYKCCMENIKRNWGELPPNNLICGDFLTANHFKNGAQLAFDHIVGNPPFGGTINYAYQDELDKLFGCRGKLKIKKETYSFFIVKSMDLLRHGGNLLFICSDTFLTISTMKGLRHFLLSNGAPEIENIPFFSDEVSQKTVILKCKKGVCANSISIDGTKISADNIYTTPNYSWAVDSTTVKFFRGQKLGDFMVASSGMTVGKNEYFIRTINNGKILEPYKFSFYQKPITVDDAVARARLQKLSRARLETIEQQQLNGETIRDIRVAKRNRPVSIEIPHPDYCYYNKARRGIVYANPEHVIFWRDDGDAVYTYKKNGNWYLNGVGGKKYFFREGITWNLIASKLSPRYLPSGHVLDSGAPCAFLKPGVAQDELFFILAWGLSDLCSFILKKTINHTKNIQSKDFERLPYPFWVTSSQKASVIRHIKKLVAEAKAGRVFSRADTEIQELSAIFSDSEFPKVIPKPKLRQQTSLIACNNENLMGIANSG